MLGLPALAQCCCSWLAGWLAADVYLSFSTGKNVETGLGHRKYFSQACWRALPPICPCLCLFPCAQVAVLALGHAHPSAHGLVVTEAAALVEDYAERSVQRVRGSG